MFKPTKAKSTKEYIAALPKERQEMIASLHGFIQKTAPKLKPYFAHNMLGYGKFAYKNHKKETLDWPIIALANQKQYVSVYVCAVRDGQYIAEKYKKELGNVRVGRSCISFKKLEDIRLPVLKKVIQEAAKHPGFVEAQSVVK